jgi:hypothetical protein
LGGGGGGEPIPTEKIVVCTNSYYNIKILLNFRYQREMARHRRHQREARQKCELQPPFFSLTHARAWSFISQVIQRLNCAVRTRGLFYNHLPLIVKRSPECLLCNPSVPQCREDEMAKRLSNMDLVEATK